METKLCQTLVVDDDEAVQEILKETLSEQGMVVQTASSAEEALEIFAVREIDVVVTDVQMGGMSGFDLLKRLKLVDQSVKVIVMTSYNSYESVLQALQLGAYDYLQKPLDNFPAVVAAIQRAYENAKLQQENLDLLVQLKGSHDQLSAANRSLKEANRKLKHLAVTDGLTKLYNRRFFDQVFKREVGRRNRYKLPLSVVMIDIDNFKSFNDTYGHHGGDIAIKAVAEVLVESARTTDIIARYGGEEFVVALPLTEPSKSITFAERVRKNIEKRVIEISDNESTSLTLSIGISGVDAKQKPVSTSELLKTADQALYQSKAQGKNQCQLFEITSNKGKAA